MDSSIPDNVAASPARKSIAKERSETTNNHDEQLTLNLNQLSLQTNSSTSYSPSPEVIPSPHRKQSLTAQYNYPPSPVGNGTRPQYIQQGPGSMSANARSSAPTLNKKSSLSSLHAGSGGTPPRSSSSRRTSMQLSSGQGMPKSPLASMDEQPLPPPPLTAATVASAHFSSELDNFHSLQEQDSRPTETIVILHDSCYGHRYSRPRTSRAGLSTIVERPERIHASIVGLSMAYVRLGERHVGGQCSPDPRKDVAEIRSIPFRIRKTTRKINLASPAVTNVHGTKWMEELKIMCDTAESKLAANGKELTRPEMTRSPDQEIPHKFHEGDLYLCSESLNAMEGALGAVCEGVDAVFEGVETGNGPRRAFVTIRPPGHHCSASYPSGFCWLNNVHVGISHAALNHGLTHVAMIDFDLHHGDGSQAITWEHNMRATTLPKNAAAWKKTSIGYFSLHDINSYPCEMGDPDKVKNASLCIENAHGQNIWNVHLQPWKSEQEFWMLYETKYSVLLEKTRNFLRTQTERIKALPNGPKPKACIFFSAGFDASEWESAGMQRHKVNVPTEFYARIARDVVKLAAEEGCSVDGRIISVLEGGYSDRALSSGVLSHMSGLAGGDPTPVKREYTQNGLGYEMLQKTALPDPTAEIGDGPQAPGYDPAWWSIRHLEELDDVMDPTPLPVESKKPRDTVPPTYSSPTQSFTAKVVQSPNFLRRSSSTLSIGSPKAAPRAPSPPPPVVGWATAAHELSKLLIPTDRQTMSCKVEDLSAEATRVRKERQSILIGLPSSNGAAAPAPSTRMSLRERKAPGKPTGNTADEVTEKTSRTNRRKTVAGGAVIAAEKAVARGTTPTSEPSYAQSTTSSARRLSLASNSGSVVSRIPESRAPSVAAGSIPPRPGSSVSHRPDSSMSMKAPPVPPVPFAVKKTRGPSVKPRASRKTPPNEISNVQASSTTGLTAPQSSSISKSSSSADVDALTSGMKKFSITLTTKAQREARAKEAFDKTIKTTHAPPTKAPRSPKKATAAKKPIMPKASVDATAQPVPLPAIIAPDADRVAGLPSLSPSTPPPTYVSEPTTPQPPSGLISYAPTPSGIPLPASVPPTPQTIIVAPPPPKAPSPPPTSATSATSDIGSNVFIPYQPDGPSQMQEAKLENPGLTWLEPNTGTPAKFKSTPEDIPAISSETITRGASGVQRNKLPVFSSTGSIPFAVKKEFDDSIWEVPETPNGK